MVFMMYRLTRKFSNTKISESTLHQKYRQPYFDKYTFFTVNLPLNTAFRYTVTQTFLRYTFRHKNVQIPDYRNAGMPIGH